MVSRIAIVVPTFNGVERLRFMLSTVKRNDPMAFDVPWLIVEDPCEVTKGKEYAAETASGYDGLQKDFPIEVVHLGEWSNMHGAARKAFKIAQMAFEPEWIIYLGDDLAMTAGSVSNMIYFLSENPLETVSLVQFPYWNAHDLSINTDDEDDEDRPKLFSTKERGFYRNMDWTDRVPRNPHWDNDGYAVPYVNVNGAGFACKSKTYWKIGGFQEGTWCLDETISVKTWLQTDQSIVCLPGPPLVHYFGAATMACPPSHDLHTAQRWEEAMGMSKATADTLCRQKMAAREAVVLAEMKAADYYTCDCQNGGRA